MRASTLLLHALPGGVGIVSGYIALAAAKGARTHRRSGIVFVFAMLMLAGSGAILAAVEGSEASVLGGLLAFYLVVTALTTVRPRTELSCGVDMALLVLGLAIAAFALALGADAIARGGAREGIPAVVLFKFALVALLGSAGDVRVIRSGPRQGASRLARHLWRMCFALYIAAASFFLGQMDVIPAALRIPALLAVPALAPIPAMFYWLWRVRLRRSLRGIVALRAPEATV